MAENLLPTLVMRRRFDPADTLRLIDEYRVTTAYFVPTHFVRFLRLAEEERAGFDGASLAAVYHTAAPCPPEVKRQLTDWWDPVIHELYAATETGALGTFITGADWMAKPGPATTGPHYQASRLTPSSRISRTRSPSSVRR